MNLINDKEKLLINWYSKPYASGVILNFNSSSPPTHKINVVRGLLWRILKLSNKTFWRENIIKFKGIVFYRAKSK